jgi:hypothetical protein
MAEEYGEMIHTIVRLEEEGLPATDGYFQISTQRWYHPDIQARSGDRLFLYEVETDEGLGEPETRDRLEVLANAAAKANGQFFLVVPEDLRDSAQRLLHELHIDWGEVWGISEGRRI